MIEVTVLFKDQSQFDKFLKTNKIEEYTWKKGKITIDLSGSVKEAMADLEKQSAPVVEDVPPAPVEEPAVAPQSSLF